MYVREAGFLMAAALVHVGIPVMAHVAPRPKPALIARSSGLYREVEVEVRTVAPLRRPEARPEAPREEGAPAQDPERRAAERVRRAEQDPFGVEPAPGSEGNPEAPSFPVAPPAQPPDEYGGPPPPDGVPGLDGTPVWQLPGVLPQRKASAPAPTVAPAPRETSGDKAGEVLREAMRSKDKALGLDLPAAGTVASVIAEAVRASDTPDVARATFEVRLSGAGQVLGVRVVSSSAGAAEGWSRVARAAASRLAGRALAMTAGFVRGATVYVSVSSQIRMPSGAKSSGVQQQGAGFGFDLSDIGAHATRVVTSSFKVVAVE